MKIPQSPPRLDGMAVLFEDQEVMRRLFRADAFRPTVENRYLHWDQLRRRPPPEGVTQEQWWTAIKMARQASYKHLPNRDRDGRAFQIGLPDTLLRHLSEIDRELSGRTKLPGKLINDDTRDRYVISSLIEEAITSSQLEGAATTSVVAREMIRSNRKPRNKGERMILNNFEAMKLIREIRLRPLTPQLVLRVHSEITKDTLDDPDDAGRLRDSDDVKVTDPHNEVLHVPPTSSELDSRLAAMCAFANHETPKDYLHPIVRAIILHFWLAYDHPFVDGNGRTARALFYWSMLNSDYHLCEFVSISHILRKGPTDYARSYLFTETDDNDITYFVLHQLEVLQRGIESLFGFVKDKAKSIEKMRTKLREAPDYNYRQLALLDHALTHPYGSYTVMSHMRSHNVTAQTARVDLNRLVDRGFLRASKVGKQAVYAPVEDLEQRLQAPGNGPRVVGGGPV